jgi:anti-sigma factor RsiW
MTELTDCGDIRRALGVYIVGAIDPAERAKVDAHLPHCPDCREELAGLAGLPALLGRVPKEDAERLALGSDELEEAPAELLDSLLRQVAARRRARRWRGIAAAAAAAIIAVGGGVVGGALMAHSHSPTQVTAELARGSNPATGVTAAVYYRPAGTSGAMASETAMQVGVTGIPNGTHCVFWLTTTSGHHLWVADWTVNAAAQYGNWFSVSSHTPIEDVRSFAISNPGGKVLVTIPTDSP